MTTSIDNSAKSDFSAPETKSNPTAPPSLLMAKISFDNTAKPNLLEDLTDSKRKRVNLNLRQKLELIDKLEAGIPVKQICLEYGIKRQTVSDIRRKKHELRQFVAKYTTNLLFQQQLTTPTTNISGICKRKHMKVARDNDFENAIYQWYRTQIRNGNRVKSCDIRNMARKIADDRNLCGFKASGGWLWRFRKRLNIAKSTTQQSDLNPINRTQFEFIPIDNKFRAKQESYDRDEDYSISLVDIKNDLDGDCSMTMNIAQIGQYTDIILDYIGKSSDLALQPFLLHFNNFRKLLSKKEL